jgi:hypothetical protein
MAGAGYKLFATGDVLTAAQVNTFLMEQAVMRFADSAARTAALSGVLAEGMVSYLQDTNTLEVYDGSGWVGATGDITGLTAGTGISITSETGPVPTVAIDTAVTVDLTTAQTLTTKTLTSPVLTTPSISNIDAKGDILVGTADNTLGVITAGANGETLVADSSTSTGLRYIPATVTANPVINGAYDIFQRGTTTTGGAAKYGADRWLQGRGGATAGITTTQQLTSDTTNLPTILNCIRLQRDSGDTSTQFLYLENNFENVNSTPFVGQTVTLSFYARAGANYSAASSLMNARVISGTGTNQRAISGFTGQILEINQNATLTTTWQRFSYSATISSLATQLAVRFTMTPVGTAGADDYLEVTGAQLDLGAVALPFRRSGGTIQGELALCQRYYYRLTQLNTKPLAYGANSTTSVHRAYLYFPVEMRIAPSSLEQTGTASDYAINQFSIAPTTCTAVVTFFEASTRFALVSNTLAAATLTLFQPGGIRANADGAFLGWSAEL